MKLEHIELIALGALAVTAGYFYLNRRAFAAPSANAPAKASVLPSTSSGTVAAATAVPSWAENINGLY